MYDVIIIGSGPAGYTAAIYTSRAFLKTLVLSGEQLGGQLTTTTEVDNFPGFPKGITGPELVANMKVQAERFGTEIKIDRVQNIKIQSSNTKSSPKSQFQIITGANTYETKTVIIATGAQAKMLGVPTEEQFRGKGISYCATCDGFFFRGKNVAVLGGGDTAMEEATFLTKFASHVTIIHRREEFRASAIMLERAKKDPKISFMTNKTVTDFIGERTLKGIVMKDAVTGETEEVPFDGAFVAIGHKPSTDFLKGFVELDEKGYIVLNFKFQIPNSKNQTLNNPLLTPQTETSVPGVFAAGDCVDARYRQAIVASGMGCMSALDVEKYLEEN